MQKFRSFKLTAYAPGTEPIEFLILNQNVKTEARSLMDAFEKQGWTVTGCASVGVYDVLRRTAGAPNAGRFAASNT